MLGFGFSGLRDQRDHGRHKSAASGPQGVATAILDRGYRGPGPTIDLTSIFGAFDLTRLSDAELEQLDALRSLAAGPLIDQSGQTEVVR